MSTISISGLKLAASIGVYPWEKKIIQQLIADIEIDYDISEAARHDDLKYTVDYTEICNTAERCVKSTHFNLLETLAISLLDQLSLDFNFQRIKLIVSKPNAIKQAKNVSICLERFSEVHPP